MQPDIFGFDNIHGFRGYRGSLPPRDKTGGLLPYRYTIAVENSAHPNYCTEKMFDALLAECLPFYWGCPNLEDYIDPRAFIRLPLDDLEASRHIVAEAIAGDEWSRRIEAIRHEKRRILDELQFFPVLARVIRGHRYVERLVMRVINLERRPDRLASFRSLLAETASAQFGARIERFAAIDGRDMSLTPEIRHTFRGNDFGYRRSFVGCALSHLALWRELATGPAPAFLICEDDVTLCHGFEGQLVELLRSAGGMPSCVRRPAARLLRLATAARGRLSNPPAASSGPAAFRRRPLCRRHVCVPVSRRGRRGCWRWSSVTASKTESTASFTARRPNWKSSSQRRTSRGPRWCRRARA
jgi:hypothetical protein